MDACVACGGEQQRERTPKLMDRNANACRSWSLHRVFNICRMDQGVVDEPTKEESRMIAAASDIDEEDAADKFENGAEDEAVAVMTFTSSPLSPTGHETANASAPGPRGCRWCNVSLNGHRCPHKMDSSSVAADQVEVGQLPTGGATKRVKYGESDDDDLSSTRKRLSESLSEKKARGSMRKKLVLNYSRRRNGASVAAVNTDSHPSSLAMIGSALNQGGDESSSWAEDKVEADNREIWSKKGFTRAKVNVRPRIKGARIHSIASATDDDDDDDEKHLSAKKRPRRYTCTTCGLPLKGHVCQYRKAPASGAGVDDVDMWTEVLAPAHILLDEVHSYLVHRLSEQEEEETTGSRHRLASITDAERSFLQTWAVNVHDKLLNQNQLALENIRLSDERRNMAKIVSTERDALVALRSKIRRMRKKNQQLEERITTQAQESGTNAAATRFLDAIDTLRRTESRGTVVSNKYET